MGLLFLLLFINKIQQDATNAGIYLLQTSSSSSGPGAYAPDAPQPVGLLCNPCSILLF